MLSALLLISKLLGKNSSLFFLGATDVLPEPLTKEEEEYYLIQKEDGDDFAKDKLI